MTATITIRGRLACDPAVTTTERGTTFAHARLRSDHDGHAFDWPLMAHDKAAVSPFRAGDEIEVFGRLKARRMGMDSRTDAILPFLNDPRCYFIVFVEQIAWAGAVEAMPTEPAAPTDPAPIATAPQRRTTSPRRRVTPPVPLATDQSPLGL